MIATITRAIQRRALPLLLLVHAGALLAQPVQTWTSAWPVDSTSTAAVGDSVLLNWAPIAGTYSSYGMLDRIALRYDPRRSMVTTAMDVHVTALVRATMNPDHGNYSSGADYDSLLILEFDLGVRSDSLYPQGLDSAMARVGASAMHYSGAHEYWIKITGVTVDFGDGDSTLTGLPKGLFFDLNIDWKRTRDLNLANPPVNTATANIICDQGVSTDPHELKLQWDPVAGALGYDVEWTWVDNYGGTVNGYTDLAANLITYDLDRDASRATTIDPWLRVPLLYDKGYLIWRVRAVGAAPGQPQLTVATAWAGPAGSLTVQQAISSHPAHVKQIKAHQAKKNWQVTTSFAEEGKRKEVMTYADGSSRARQMVTRNNSLQVPIIGESIYDAIGRPAVEVMPVPIVKDNCPTNTEQWAPITYVPDFNLEDSLGNVRTYDRWDLAGQGDCGQTAEPMIDESGAERYYSNEFANDASSLIEAPQYLPRAEGFPLAHTEYTRDNTGRVRRKGGVGHDFQMDGHPTTTYYGNAMQIQLDRLFGSEAGYAQHFQRIVTLDPNNQASVAYIDMFGRTVATALECGSPAALETIGQADDELTTDLFNGLPSTSPALAQQVGNELRFNTQFAVACSARYDFTYGVQLLHLRDSCWFLEGPLCPHCVYELEMRLIDQCGEQVWPDPDTALTTTVGTLALTNAGVMFNCGEDGLWSPPSGVDMGVDLAAGEYTLTKILRLHQPAMDWYVDVMRNDSLFADTCALTYQDFLDEAMNAVDTMDCYVDCAECYAELGTLDAFLAAGRGTEADFQMLRAQCDELCRVDSWCDVLYETMLADMSKQGQYGTYTWNGLATDPISFSDRTSVFWPADHPDGPSVLRRKFLLAGTDPWQQVNGAIHLWRQPWLELDGQTFQEYRDDSGDRTKIYLVVNGSNYLPEVANTALVLDEDGSPFTYPENLVRVQDFLAAWQPGWQRSLLRFHPEYCYYRSCKEYGEPFEYESDVDAPPNTSDAFDGKLSLADTYSAAFSAGLIDSNGPTFFDLSIGDPFVHHDGSYVYDYGTYAQAIADKYAQHTNLNGTWYTMPQVATVTATLGGVFPADPNDILDFGTTSTDPAILDAEWAALRGLYRSVKYAQQKRRGDDLAKTCACAGLNYCIGQESTSTWWSRMQTSSYTWPWYSNWYSQPRNQPCQPCNYYTYWHFSGKVQRVPEPSQTPGLQNTAMQQAYAVFQATGQCPMATAWVNFFNEMANNDQLDQDGTHDITNSNGWMGVHVALNNMQMGTIAPPEDLAVDVTPGTGVSLHLVNQGCAITLDEPDAGDHPDFSWSNITYITQLVAQPFSSAFTVAIYYLDSDGMPQVAVVDGTMCEAFQLAPCNFPRLCEPNQLAQDVQDLWNMVHNNAGFTAGNLMLDSYTPAGTTEFCQDMLGSNIKGPFDQGSLAMKWQYVSAGPKIYVSNPSQPGLRYRFDILEAQPASFGFSSGEWATIAYFGGINADQENFFVITGYDANDDQVVQLRCQAWLESGGEELPVALGECDLPENPLCEGMEFDADDQLADVIEDLVYHNPLPPVDGSSPFASPSMTEALAAAICGEGDITIENVQYSSSGVQFSLACSNATGYCVTVGVPLDNGEPIGTGFNMPAIVFHSPVTGGHGYNGMYIPIAQGGGAYADVFAHCLAFMECDTCPPDPIPADSIADYSEAQMIAQGRLLVDSIWMSYRDYRGAVDSANTRLGLAPSDAGYVPTITYNEFRKKGFWNSLAAYARYLREYKPGIDEEAHAQDMALFVAEHTNAMNAKQEYARYLKAIDEYNARAMADSLPTLTAEGDSLFRALLLADELAGYVDWLYSLEPGETAPGPITDWADFDAEDPCVALYQEHYLPAYAALEAATTDSTGRCPGFQKYAPLVSYKEFESAKLCCSDSGLVVLEAYLELFTDDSLECPGEIPRLIDCAAADSVSMKVLLDPESECQRLYLLWVEAVEKYMDPVPHQAATGTILEVSYPTFEEFLAAGLCDCVQDYLKYLEPYLYWQENDPELPYLLSITEFCTGTVKPCKDLYLEYVEAIKDYNESAFADSTQYYLTPDASSFEEFERFGYCRCVQAYLNYLAGYIAWTSAAGEWPSPLSIAEFCRMQGDPDCRSVYQLYIAELIAWQPTLLAIYDEYHLEFTFSIPTWEDFNRLGICYCVPGYLARLELLLGTDIEEMDIELFQNDGTVWSILRYCNLPQPCPPQPPPPITPDIPFTDENDCVRDLLQIAAMNAAQAWEAYQQARANEFLERYRELCLGAQETLQLTFDNTEHHFTLYYYDQAGSLIRTVPPEGVKLTEITNPTDSIAARISNDRASGLQTYFTNHNLVSDHVYNSLGQPIRSGMPDQDPRPEWSLSEPLGIPSAMVITGVHFSGAKGFASGYRHDNDDRGVAYTTGDGGRTWARSWNLLGADLYGGHYPSSSTGYAVGDHGTLIKTIDGGASWDLVQSNELLDDRPLLRDAFFSNATTGLVVGDGAYAAHTSNSGVDFTAITSLTDAGDLYGCGYDGTGGFVIGGVNNFTDPNGILYYSGTLGGGWTPVPHARTAADLTCGQYVDANNSFAGGALGVLLKSTDNGDTWATRATGTTWNFIDMAWRDAQNGVAILDSMNLGTHGVPRHTTDGGKTWLPIDGMPLVNLRDLYVYESGPTTKVLAVGANGRVMRFFIGAGTVGFANTQGLPTDSDLQRGWAVLEGSNLVTVVAGSSNGDGVVHWSQQLAVNPVAWSTAPLVSGNPILDVTSHSIGTELRTLLRMSNGTYRHATLTYSSNSWDTWISGGTGVTGIVSYNGGLAAVLQGGVPVIEVDLADSPISTGTLTSTGTLPAAHNAVLPLATTAAMLTGADGHLHKASISGSNWTWTDRSAKIKPLPIRAVHKDGTLAVADQGTVLTGSGGNWTAFPTPHVDGLRSAAWLNGTEAVAVGENSSAFIIDVSGNSTTPLPVPASGTLHSADVRSGTLYLGADAGRVLRCTNPTAATPTFTAMNWNGGAVRALVPVNSSTLNAFGQQAMVHAINGTVRMPVQEVYVPKLNAVWSRNALTAYMAGDANTVRYTNNGGLSWQVVPVGGGLNPLMSVAGNHQTAFAGGAGKRLIELSGPGYSVPTMPGVGSGSTELRGLALTRGGGLLVAAADGAAGRWYTRTATNAWATDATGAPLNTAWAFPRFMIDQTGITNESSHEDLLMGGDDGYVAIKRYVPSGGGSFSTSPTWNSTIAGNPDIKAFWFHDQTSGYALVHGGSGSRLHKVVSGQSDHGGAFIWGNTGTPILTEGGTTESNAQPNCIGFADRGTGFVGGYNSVANNGFTRLITDEGGLYSQRFWYDALGRLVISQNSKQAAMTEPRYSYSLYDELGRVYEAGEVEDAAAAPDRFLDLPATDVNGALLPQVIDPTVLKDWVLTRPRHEVTRTYYDEPMAGLSVPGFTQAHLRLRVASTCYYDDEYAQATPDEDHYDHATHYSYDIHGNVRTLIQDHPQLGIDGGTIAPGCTGCVEHRYKRMDYSYDLISGNVRQVDYQKDQPDRFHHLYTYDADNRITEVKSSADGADWHRDAAYFYYPHGPLARVELGEHLVQGTDYAYTLQGWLKGINGDRLNPNTDMGRDGDPSVMGNPNLLAGRDAFAMSLGYHGDADYKAIGDVWNTVAERPFAPIGSSGTLHDAHYALYNGNIAHTVNTLQPFGLWNSGNGSQGQVLAQVYRYDQLNRLKKARGVEGLTSTNTWDNITDAATNRYRSQYEYDANGNILTAERWNADGSARYDSLHYHYHDDGGRRQRNRLYHLQDLAADGIVTAPDPDDLKKTTLAFDTDLEEINTPLSTNNYRYDALGNLIYDEREQIDNIEWTVAGKVKRVERPGTSSLKELRFAYGASGQRIAKQVTPDPDLDATGYREHYIRDAQGNIMATYRYSNPGSASLKLNERPLYGSSRLGSLRKEEELRALPSFDPVAANPVQQIDLNYELTDHLGNVCAVVTGRLLDGNGGGTPKQAELVSAQGYEPFGSLLPGRNYSSDAYRFGFQGQEKDDEVFGSTGSAISFEYRVHDARVGRFLSIDPLAQDFPWNSPYAFSENRVIDAFELEGAEATLIQESGHDKGGGFDWSYTKITVATNVEIQAAAMSTTTRDQIQLRAGHILEAGMQSADRPKFNVVTTDVQFTNGNSSAGWQAVFLSPADFEAKMVSLGMSAADARGVRGYTERMGSGSTQTNVFYMRYLGDTEADIDAMSRTLAHEMGHGMDLNHPDRTDRNGKVCFTCPAPEVTVDQSRNNLMRQSSQTSGTDIKPEQVQDVVKAIKRDGGAKTPAGTPVP